MLKRVFRNERIYFCQFFILPKFFILLLGTINIHFTGLMENGVEFMGPWEITIRVDKRAAP
jgi:hypothetical protein